MECNTKKHWKTPELVVFGAVEELTQQTKYKRLGTRTILVKWHFECLIVCEVGS